jgi:hypothetical protein
MGSGEGGATGGSAGAFMVLLNKGVTKANLISYAGFVTRLKKITISDHHTLLFGHDLFDRRLYGSAL